MAIFNLAKRYPWQGPLTRRATQICRMFGLTIDRLTDSAPMHQCRLDLRPGDIVYITGPSGSGKSVLLRALREVVGAGESIDLAELALPGDKSVIDCFDSDVVSSLRTLGTVGLSEVFSILNRPCHLSDGQKYRFRLAQALAAQKPFVFADEFCSDLDRITAATVSFNIHKFAKRTETTFVLASCHEDILIDLAPDVVVIKDFSGPAEVILKDRR